MQTKLDAYFTTTKKEELTQEEIEFLNTPNNTGYSIPFKRILDLSLENFILGIKNSVFLKTDLEAWMNNNYKDLTQEEKKQLKKFWNIEWC